MKLRLLIIHRFRKALKRSSIKFIFQPFTLTKLLITGTRRICSRGFWNRSRRWGVGSWGGGKLTGSRTKGRCCRNFNAKLTNTHVISGIIKQLITFVGVPDVLKRTFPLSDVVMMSVSVEIKSYWAWRENSESVKQYARILWASLTSSLEVARYDYLLHRCFLNVPTSSDKRRELKRKVTFNSFKPVIF